MPSFVRGGYLFIDVYWTTKTTQAAISGEERRQFVRMTKQYSNM